MKKEQRERERKRKEGKERKKEGREGRRRENKGNENMYKVYEGRDFCLFCSQLYFQPLEYCPARCWTQRVFVK